MPLTSIETSVSGARIGFWEITEPWEHLLNTLGADSEELLTLAGRKSDLRKAQFLAARLLLSAMLGRRACIRYNDDGSPRTDQEGLFISVSHSDRYVVLALKAHSPVGIDVQTTPKPALQRALPYYLSPREVNELICPDDVVSLHLYWSAKEALFKYAGEKTFGLSTHFYIAPFRRRETGRMKGRIHGKYCDVGLSYRVTDRFVLVVTEDRMSSHFPENDPVPDTARYPAYQELMTD